MKVWIALCAAACAVLLVSLRRGSALGVWLSKPVAAGAFVAAGIAAGGLEWGVGRWIVAALALSWLGDLLLIPSGTGACFGADAYLGYVRDCGRYESRTVRAHVEYQDRLEDWVEISTWHGP